MANYFVDEEVVAFNTKLHDKRHCASPSENVVRLVKWFLSNPDTFWITGAETVQIMSRFNDGATRGVPLGDDV